MKENEDLEKLIAWHDRTGANNTDDICTGMLLCISEENVGWFAKRASQRLLEDLRETVGRLPASDVGWQEKEIVIGGTIIIPNGTSNEERRLRLEKMNAEYKRRMRAGVVALRHFLKW